MAFRGICGKLRFATVIAAETIIRVYLVLILEVNWWYEILEDN